MRPVQRDHEAPKDQDWGRYRLRQGCAKVALRMKRTGEGKGQGFKAEALADGHSERQLESWARGHRKVTVSV